MSSIPPTMRALVVEALAPDFGGCAVREIPTPRPGPGEDLVRVRGLGGGPRIYANLGKFPEISETE